MRLLLPLLLLATPAAATDLLTAYRQALAHDALYLSAAATHAADRQETAKAVSGLLPSLAFTGTTTRNDTTTTVPDARGHDVTSRLYYYSQSYALTLRQPLYRKQSWAGLRGAQAIAARADATLKQESQALALRVAGAYFDALLAETELRMETAKKLTLEKTFEMTEKALKSGAGTVIDVYEVQARRDLSGAFELEAENALQNARMALQSVMSAEPGALSGIEASRLPAIEASGKVEDWLFHVERSNPALAALRAELDSALQEKEKAISGHYPTLDFIASHRRASNEIDTLLNRGTRTSLAGLQLSVPIFSGGYARAATVQADLRAERVRQRLEAARREAGLVVRREYGILRLNASKVAAFERALASSEQALRGTERGVLAGTRTTIDVLNAQDQVFRTRTELARASCRYALSWLKLKEAVGGLDQDAIAVVNAWLVPN